MPLTDRERKILWARSGNQCAICGGPLVEAETALDDESVIGQECHIVSGAKTGPRSNAKFPRKSLDSPDNLILLCANHHKMVDDQREFYSPEKLRQIKKEHEQRVEARLSKSRTRDGARLRRRCENLPAFMVLIQDGQELARLYSSCLALSASHPTELTPEEVEQIADFIQEISDWKDALGDLSPGQRIRAAAHIGEMIADLEQAGFLVFAAREDFVTGEDSPFPVLHLSVTRDDDPAIIFLGDEPGSAPSAEHAGTDTPPQ